MTSNKTRNRQNMPRLDAIGAHAIVEKVNAHGTKAVALELGIPKPTLNTWLRQNAKAIRKWEAVSVDTQK